MSTPTFPKLSFLDNCAAIFALLKQKRRIFIKILRVHFPKEWFIKSLLQYGRCDVMWTVTLYIINFCFLHTRKWHQRRGDNSFQMSSRWREGWRRRGRAKRTKQTLVIQGMLYDSVSFEFDHDKQNSQVVNYTTTTQDFFKHIQKRGLTCMRSHDQKGREITYLNTRVQVSASELDYFHLHHQMEV